MSWMTEHPRPQLKRESFLTLNGQWLLNDAPIAVPFPPESRLSGYEGALPSSLIYTRAFTLPENFRRKNERVRLHFGAVDQIAEVWLNNRPVTRHEGGYLPFFADVTDLLTNGENTLTVCALDLLSTDYPYGKQSRKRGGMWYTPVSGIWQSVWLEAVPENPIEKIQITPDLTGVTLSVDCEKPVCQVEIPGVVTCIIETGQPVRLDIPNPQHWSPENPHLYPLILATNDDRVESYFALRTIEIQNSRILLNGKPCFLNGVLDQGYFEDGLYLPASPEEYERDILRMKEMGINLLRKHIKIEPEAFYYACDRLGMLVMQDMVNSGPYHFILDTALPTIGLDRRSDRVKNASSAPRRSFFTQHCMDTVRHLFNHPCIIAWTIFNEGWGQFNADEHYARLRAEDATRLIDSTSGWFHQEKSDFDSRHVYFRNKKLKGRGKPLLLSECGGYARPVEGHMFNPTNKYGCGTADTADALTEKIEKMYEEMVFPAIPEGLAGLIYTQLSDIEDEINGLYTYDRAVCKVHPEKLRALAEKAQKMYKK